MAGEMLIYAAIEESAGAVGDGGSIDATSDPSVVTQEPSDVSIATSASPDDATWRADNEQDVDVIAVVNHNWPREIGTRWRAWLNGVDGSYSPGIYKKLAVAVPTITADSSNTSGGFANVDVNPWTGTFGSPMHGSAAGTYWALLEFASPGGLCGDSDTGSPTQAFVVVGSWATTPTPTVRTVTVELWEGGSFVRKILDAVPYSQGCFAVAYWDASELFDPTGANQPQVRIEFDDMDAAIYSVAWVQGLPSLDASYDSGWVEIDSLAAPPSWGQVSPEAVAGEPVKNEFMLLASTVAAADAGYATVSCLCPLRTLDDPQVGVLTAGKGWRPSSNFTGLTLGVADASKKSRTLGGQDIIAARDRRRVATWTLEGVSREDFVQLFHRIDWRKGSTGAFLVAFFPEDSVLRPTTTFWVTLDTQTSQPWTPYTGTDGSDSVPLLFTRQFAVEEKL